MKYNPADATFFQQDDKRGQTTEFEGPLGEAFKQIYGDEFKERNSYKKIKSYYNWTIHPLFQKIQEFKSNTARQLDGENSKCDEIFADYLVKMANYVNSYYFVKLVKFITLFRECVNILNKCKVKSDDKDFTEISNSEDVPDISNEFITEFLDADQNLFDFNKEDAIDLTQNFCHWLYENNFTCSKLSLISSSY